MLRNKKEYTISPAFADILKTRILNWAQQFSILVFLDNNNYPSAYDGYECLLAAGARDTVTDHTNDPLAYLQQKHDTAKDWMFGHICYDYKNTLEPKLSSKHNPLQGYPSFHFFIPEIVCFINRAKDTFTIESFVDPALIYDTIFSTAEPATTTAIPALTFTATTKKDDYISIINKLRQHIADGDCYEINYCCGGYAEQANIDPPAVFQALNTLSPAPFAAYYRLHNNFMMCASPERYLRKEENTILSQPIKGTARRDKDPIKDEDIREALKKDVKERAENVMIVDLVRNDFARCCAVGSVKVDELFGIYSFPQVHQMISTVSGLLNAGAPFTNAIHTTFPMGSMTGAPKYKVMQLIDNYESTRRELFSGTIGYITPSGNFDFNVIIRSLFYNKADGYLSYQTGGAITYDSNPEREWDEMRLKAWALERIFQENT